ncbi:MAG TPA: glutamate--tRNA ligase [Acidimicrobiia bacterium]|nr:glutamate--tRNA ligase [Acidimicrobiia bacterium]
MSVRVRIAPSPTGLIHVGNVRAALFNWLFARHHGGAFIVRIDDTDRERSLPEYEEDILEGFRWMGLDWDEGVEVGGPHGTYRQSDRFAHYQEVARHLVDAGFAYFDDRSPEELEALRQRAQAEKRHPNYYIRRPSRVAEAGAIRFSVPQDQAVEFEDVVREAMRFAPETIDDFVILRTDGVPTYHLASTVDDVDYEITHVIRGEDLLPSTPKHILLTKALGGTPPVYAHLPLLFGPDGKKLSKRHGDTSLRAYREGGYLPEAMVNFMSLLGWSLEGDRTIFTREEAVAAFDLARVSKNPAIFDLEKLAWLNGEYIRALSPSSFAERVRPYMEEGLGRGLGPDEWEAFLTMAPLVQERVKFLTEVAGQVQFLFVDELDYDPGSWAKVMTGPAGQVLEEARKRLDSVELWEKETLEERLRAMLEDLGFSARQGLQPLRVAITGSAVSPPLFESMAVLGRDRTLTRLDAAHTRLVEAGPPQ